MLRRQRSISFSGPTSPIVFDVCFDFDDDDEQGHNKNLAPCQDFWSEPKETEEEDGIGGESVKTCRVSSYQKDLWCLKDFRSVFMTWQQVNSNLRNFKDSPGVRNHVKRLHE